ncbi:MAG: MFS transporter [Clostridia bacterium]|nr:MFS transporter [Clostridia bacterium]
MKEKKAINPYTALTWLCWLVYSSAYVGKLSYAANISQVIAYYKVSHADAGVVSTCLFFAYAVGQFVNGVFNKRYNIRLVVTVSLALSCAVNLVLAITDYFPVVKYLWIVNGFAQSVLWPTLIRLLAECLPEKSMSYASVIMGAASPVGTVVIYAVSALYVKINFKLAFYTAAILLPIVILIWVCTSGVLMKKAKENGAMEDGEKMEENAAQRIPAAPVSVKTKQKIPFDLMLTIIFLAVFAVGVNLIADGLTTWVPSILKESFGFDDSLSIILTVALPLITVFSNFFAVMLHKKMPDFIHKSALLFAITGGLILLIIGMFSLKQAIVTIVCFALVRGLLGCVNSLVNGVFPLFMKEKINSGMIAGVLNGFCYVGSTASSYGLGLVADHHGWTAVFWLLFAVCVLVCVMWVGYVIVKSVYKKKKAD